MIFQVETSRGWLTYSAKCDKCGYLSRMGCNISDHYASMLTEAGWKIEGSRCTCPKCNDKLSKAKSDERNERNDRKREILDAME